MAAEHTDPAAFRIPFTVICENLEYANVIIEYWGERLAENHEYHREHGLYSLEYDEQEEEKRKQEEQEITQELGDEVLGHHARLLEIFDNGNWLYNEDMPLLHNHRHFEGVRGVPLYSFRLEQDRAEGVFASANSPGYRFRVAFDRACRIRAGIDRQWVRNLFLTLWFSTAWGGKHALGKMLDQHRYDFERMWGRRGLLYRENAKHPSFMLESWKNHQEVMKLVEKVQGTCNRLWAQIKEIEMSAREYKIAKRQASSVSQSGV